MDDFEDARVRQHRGLRRADWDDNKIPPEKRGKVTCPTCKGASGSYRPMIAPCGKKINVYETCGPCKGQGEVPK